MRIHRVFATFALMLAACGRPPEADPRFVSELMSAMYGAIRAERLSPPVASRLMTYSTSALYSGLALSDTAMRGLQGALNDFPRLPTAERRRQYDGEIAALAANRVVIDTLLREALPTTRASLSRLADSLEGSRAAAGVADEVRSRSARLGHDIGLAIVAWSRRDGFDQTRGRKYAAPVGPGLWVNDAPANVYASQNMSGASDFVALDNPANVMQAGNASDRALILNRPKKSVATMPAVNMAGTSEPYWREVRPFGLRSWSECAIAPPPPYSTDTGSALYREARAVVQAQQTLTAEQKTVALYWADNAGESGTPVGHWISIASQMVGTRRLTAAEAARLVLLTSAAQADAFIASWGYKYQYSLLRPRTYIRRVMDATWEPLIPTPPFPEYPSGHSTQSAAAAGIMTSLLGATPFDDSTSVTIGHSVRRFDSFTAAADEAGVSRIYGGIHYPTANSNGQALGRCIAERILARYTSAH